MKAFPFVSNLLVPLQTLLTLKKEIAENGQIIKSINSRLSRVDGKINLNKVKLNEVNDQLKVYIYAIFLNAV